MENISIGSSHTWHPLSSFAIDHPFFELNPDTMIYTWLALGLIVIVSLVMRYFLTRKTGIARYLFIAPARFFKDLTEQTLGSFMTEHFYFVTAVFIFLFVCNTMAFLPWTEEPTKDINTTLAMGLVSFFYIQVYSIKSHGISGYLKEYFTPVFFMFPLHVISKLSSIVSLSFRLFGNIFGGAVIGQIYLSLIQGSLILETLGLLSGINFLIVTFFVLFEGMLQAFVFAMLSLTYLAIALSSEHDSPHLGDIP